LASKRRMESGSLTLLWKLTESGITSDRPLD
jgi:hypothetical protein